MEFDSAAAIIALKALIKPGSFTDSTQKVALTTANANNAEQTTIIVLLVLVFIN